ncbi:epoxide hydrolase family protein [uncultured Arthrobacter sp.]|uniref:epoxide hydrolase family protein n=1 Tax=uncultured Arthrobacter sp. TaxID=114050 RepID=UPI0025FF3308|nr:epoxide hydrolase family protein [uncultured Arthrobacter sp.]
MQPEPFKIDIPQQSLDDLATRLRGTRWAPEANNADWSFGTNGAYLRELVQYWLDEYDWRASETAMNELDHYRVTIDDIPIHFVKVSSPSPHAKPLLLTHGWPWTFWDFRKIIGPLSDPESYGGDARDAFEIIIPSLPGFAFSTPLAQSGLNWVSTADLWAKLMTDVLGYDRFAAAGGDFGGFVALQMGHKYPQFVTGVHTTLALPFPIFRTDRPWSLGSLAEDESSPQVDPWERKFASHMAVQMLEPQTLAWSMHDSPVGMAAWLIQRKRTWSDCGGDLESRFTKDELLDLVNLYWFTDSFGSSIRFYSDTMNATWAPSRTEMPMVTVPTGFSLFPKDVPPPTDREWLEEYFNLRLARYHENGGHFSHAEEPEILATDIRDTFRGLS